MQSRALFPIWNLESKNSRDVGTESLCFESVVVDSEGKEVVKQAKRQSLLFLKDEGFPGSHVINGTDSKIILKKLTLRIGTASAHPSYVQVGL